MFVYDQDSFFAKDIVRWIDYALLFIFLVLPLAASVDGQEFNVHFLCIITGALFAMGITGHALDKTDFFIEELGEKEANKKVNYALVYATISFILCTSLVFYLSYFFFILSDRYAFDIPFWGYLIPLPILLFFLLNIFNIGSLFYPLFAKDLSF